MSHLVAPSILAADFGNLHRDINLINNSNADWIHIDVMDGVFVPNISFGFPVIKSVKKVAKKPLDVHLMIVEPDKYIEDFKNVGADILNVHYEACTHLHRTIQHIKHLGMKAAVTINPHTPVAMLENIIKDLDMVLIMSVNPGFGGQQFINFTYEKIKALANLIYQKNTNTLIEVDGGVDLQNAPLLVKSGVNVLVAGSSIFGSARPVETIDKLKSASYNEA